jgi:hypothetical protein
MFLSYYSYLNAQDAKISSPFDKILDGVTKFNNSNEAYSIIGLNVLGYYNLEDKYDTELKRKVFFESEEYKEKLRILKEYKNKLLSDKYYILINEPFDSDYDLKNKGFKSENNRNHGMGTAAAQAPKQINDIYFSSLPFIYEPDEFIHNSNLKTEYLFIPIKEKDAINIEQNPKDYCIYLVFNLISKLSKVKYKYMCLTYGWYDMTENALAAKDVTMLVIKKSTHEILFQKSYK